MSRPRARSFVPLRPATVAACDAATPVPTPAAADSSADVDTAISFPCLLPASILQRRFPSIVQSDGEQLAETIFSQEESSPDHRPEEGRENCLKQRTATAQMDSDSAAQITGEQHRPNDGGPGNCVEDRAGKQQDRNR